MGDQGSAQPAAVYGVRWVALVRELHRRGIGQMAVVLRHGARRYGAPADDHLMPLTEEGRKAAREVGASLPLGLRVRTFSSPAARCIDTAERVAEGFGASGGLADENRVLRALGGDFVRDPKAAVGRAYEIGSPAFVREWFGGQVATRVIEDGRWAAGIMIREVADLLEDLIHPQLCVCASHDWNVYMLKRYALGMDPAGFSNVGYLEGVVLYRDAGRLWAVSHEAGPVAVPLGDEEPRGE